MPILPYSFNRIENKISLNIPSCTCYTGRSTQINTFCIRSQAMHIDNDHKNIFIPYFLHI